MVNRNCEGLGRPATRAGSKCQLIAYATPTGACGAPGTWGTLESRVEATRKVKGQMAEKIMGAPGEDPDDWRGRFEGGTRLLDYRDVIRRTGRQFRP